MAFVLAEMFSTFPVLYVDCRYIYNVHWYLQSNRNRELMLELIKEDAGREISQWIYFEREK